MQMKTIILGLTILMGICANVCAQENYTESFLHKKVLEGFHRLAYAIDHDNDSIAFVAQPFETYWDALRKLETQEIAEKAYCPWSVLGWLAKTYSSTNNSKLIELFTFSNVYYDKKKMHDLNAFWSVVEPCIIYCRQNNDTIFLGQLSDAFDRKLTLENDTTFLRAVGYYLKACWYNSQNDVEKCIQFNEKAYSEARKYEQKIRHTADYGFYEDIVSNIVQIYYLKGKYEQVLNILSENETCLKAHHYSDTTQQYLWVIAYKLDVLTKLGRYKRGRMTAVQLDSLIDKARNLTPHYLDYFKDVLNKCKEILGVASTQKEAPNVDEYSLKFQQAVNKFDAGNLTDAQKELEELLVKTEPNVNDGNFLWYINIVGTYVSIITSRLDVNAALKVLHHADSVVAEKCKLDNYATRYTKELYATVLNRVGNYRQAKKYINQAKQLYEQAGDHSVKYYSCLENMFDIYYQLGDYAYCKLLLDYLNNYYEIQIRDENFKQKWTAFEGAMGVYYSMLGYVSESRKLLEKALGDNDMSQKGDGWNKYRRMLGMAYAMEKNYGACKKVFLKTLQLTDDAMEKNLALRAIVGCCIMEKTDDALIYSKQYNESAKRQIEMISQTASKLQYQKFWELSSSYMSELNNYVLYAYSEKPQTARIAFDNALYTKCKPLRNNLELVNFGDVCQSLGENEVAIEFISVPTVFFESAQSSHYGALLARKGLDFPIYIDLCDKKILDESIENFMRATPELINQKYSLKDTSYYKLIFEKIETYLHKGEVVYYSPIGSLCFVNLSAISNGTKRLSDVFQLKQVTSTALIKDLKKYEILSSGDIAIYGGINYDESLDEFLKASRKYDKHDAENNLMTKTVLAHDMTRGAMNSFLEGTLEEAIYIKDIFEKHGNKVLFFTGNDANEESFKNLSGNAPKILHIGTHGFALATDMERSQHRNIVEKDIALDDWSNMAMLHSGLLFAGANKTWRGESIPQGVEDGILTAFEMSQLDLKKCKLVVLSACESGLGFMSQFGAEVGQKQALKQAGVGCIVFTLWQVPDESTAMLMKEFYHNIVKGDSARIALKKAQDIVAKTYKSPYFWAGFSIID